MLQNYGDQGLQTFSLPHLPLCLPSPPTQFSHPPALLPNTFEIPNKLLLFPPLLLPPLSSHLSPSPSPPPHEAQSKNAMDSTEPSRARTSSTGTAVSMLVPDKRPLRLPAVRRAIQIRRRYRRQASLTSTPRDRLAPRTGSTHNPLSQRNLLCYFSHDRGTDSNLIEGTVT